MRGRKHPLEIFRAGGREFFTLRAARPDSSREEGGEPPERPRPAAARGGPARGTARRSMPLPRVAYLLAALVLLVGGTYAFALWLFAPGGSPGEGSLPHLSLWRDPVLDGVGGSGAPSGETGSDPSESGDPADSNAGDGKTPEAGTDIEYWVLAASVKLETPELKRTWQERFQPDKQRLLSALGAEFPDMSVQLCQTRDGAEAMLRVGPAPTRDDPELARLLARVQGLSERFGKAYIKSWRRR